MSLSARRAWIEIPSVLLMCSQSLSLSARRAWIEILCEWRTYQAGEVALRKESVDRNMRHPTPISTTSMSLSARRAWIEMPTL